MKRPLLACAGAVMAGVLLAGRPWPAVLAGMLFLGLAAVLLDRFVPAWRPMRRWWLLVAVVAAMGFLRHEWLLADMTGRFLPWDGRTVTVTGCLADEPQWRSYGTVYTIRVEQLAASEGDSHVAHVFRPGGRIRVVRYGAADLTDAGSMRYGDRIEVAGTLRLPRGERNPGGFDMALYLAARGTTGQLDVESPPRRLAGNDGLPPVAVGLRWKASAVSVLNRYLPAETAPVMAGMLLGETSALDPELEADFRTAGLSHIMAVSGANVAFLLMPAMWLLRRLGVNRRRASVLSVPLLLVYVLMTGFDASIVRAALMASLMLAGGMLWRRADMAASLAAACVLMLLVNSAWLFDAGFRLSFLATGAIGLFCEPLSRRLPKVVPGVVRETLAATLSAQAGVLPVLLDAFHTLSVVSVPVNLLVVPLTGLLTLLGALLVLAGLLVPAAGSVVGGVLGWMIDIMVRIVRHAADLPYAAVPVPSPPAVLVLVYGLWLGGLRFGRELLGIDRRKRMLPAALLLTVVCVLLALRPAPRLAVTVADVGQGDGMLVRTPGGAALLIDGGGSRLDTVGDRTGERVMLPLLYDAGVLSPDLVVSTHAHADHVQGLATVVRQAGAGAVVLPEGMPGYGETDGLVQACRERGVPLRGVKAGDVLWQEPDLALQVLSPDASELAFAKGTDKSSLDAESMDLNESSLVLRLTYRDFSMLLMADAGTATEERLLASGGVEHADVLKIGHHGSDSATTARFTEAVGPSAAVVSVGRNNYGHPSPAVLKRLRARGIPVHATLDGGAWLLVTDGRTFAARSHVKPVRSLFTGVFAVSHARQASKP